MAFYLDLEKNIQQVDEDIVNVQIKSDFEAVAILKKNPEKEISKTYKNLSDFQRLQLARHPDRPYTLDHIDLILDNKYEIHGGRAFRDDPAIVCFMGYLGDKKLTVIGEQEGRGTKDKIARNFGMPHPEGCRKTLRVAKMAEKFQIPILFLIDTPSAYPGIGAEEGGQNEAIATNLYELSDLKAPTTAIVIGKGGSGGALAIGVADKLAMMKNSVFSVTFPEGCTAILWNDPAKNEVATRVMKVSVDDLKVQGLVNGMIEEPIMGVHRDKENTAVATADYVKKTPDELENIDTRELVANRMQKILKLGAFKENS